MDRSARSLPGESTTVDAGAVELHVRRAGPADGPPVVLLHGFPEFWYGWRGQIGPLADAGYRVLVPDQRGHNRSDRPADRRAYGIDRLVGDVAGLLDATGHAAARVVGHDWGAMVAWLLAAEAPDRVDRLGVLNVPHPGAYVRTLRAEPRQALRSAYAALFRLPRAPEAALRARNYRLLARTLTASSRPGTFDERDLERYRAAWDREGALTGMLNWYRANGLRSGPLGREDRIAPETLILWGARDAALLRGNAERSLDYCERGDLAVFEDATHWLHHEYPDAVADRLLAFLD
ncbi:alpha/beta hydrolase [Halobacteriales archaeon QS_5_70_17]|nr:MAG: alpha/beta hydrolase [Halobacteriales archaeon QS_5_70_17]